MRTTTSPRWVDGEPATFWKTEHYKRFFKKGVGLMLDAGRSLGLSRIVVKTDLRGSSAQSSSATTRLGPSTRSRPSAR